jgi:hypothetical protein
MESRYRKKRRNLRIMKILVENKGAEGDTLNFNVRVEETNFNVNADKLYVHMLAGNNIDYSEFIKKTFEFLLERESKESILKSFDISIIKKYFPEYEDVMISKYDQL